MKPINSNEHLGDTKIFGQLPFDYNQNECKHQKDSDYYTVTKGGDDIVRMAPHISEVDIVMGEDETEGVGLLSQTEPVSTDPMLRCPVMRV